MFLGDRYELQEQPMVDGVIAFYRGRDMQTSKRVTIGLLRDVYKTDPKFVMRFQRGVKANVSLQHPNIVQVFDYGQSDGNYFIVMEMIEGTDLRHYLRSHGVLEVERAVVIAHDVAIVLGYMHDRDIVHGCLNLNKILIGRGGDIKLVIFGLNWMWYYAPEHSRGVHSPATDVYLLGNIMYEMLTGHAVFDGDAPAAIAMNHTYDAPNPPSEFNPNIPGPLEEIIMKCLEKEPEKRFRNGSELARALERIAEHLL